MKRKIEAIKTEVINTPFTGSELVTVFNNHLREFGVEVTITSSSEMPINTASVNGYFDSGDWDMEENIELVLIVNDEDSNIVINNDSWDFLSHQVQQTLEHEMIHREQVSKRSGLMVMPVYPDNMSAEQMRVAYLSDPDEIDAYSNDIVLDLLKVYNRNEAALALVRYNTIKQETCPVLIDYIDTFGHNSDIVKLIIKKAMKRIQS